MHPSVDDAELKIRLALGRFLKDLEVRRSLAMEPRLAYTYSTSKHPTMGVKATVKIGQKKKGVMSVTFFPANEEQAIEMFEDGLTQALKEACRRKAEGKDVTLVEVTLTPMATPPDAPLGGGRAPKLRSRSEREAEKERGEDLDGPAEAV